MSGGDRNTRRFACEPVGELMNVLSDGQLVRPLVRAQPSVNVSESVAPPGVMLS